MSCFVGTHTLSCIVFECVHVVKKTGQKDPENVHDEATKLENIKRGGQIEERRDGK